MIKGQKDICYEIGCHTVGNKNATEQKLGEVSSDLDLLRYDEAKNSSV